MAVHVGDTGVAETQMYLTGAVRINGVRHIARSDRGPVEMGTAVVVVGDDPLGLVVRPIEADAEAKKLPNHGQRAYATPEERARAAEDRREAEIRAEWAAHRRRGAVLGALGGLATAGVGLWAQWGALPELTGLQPNVTAAIALVAGAVWGALVFLLLDSVLGFFEEGYRRVAVASTCLGLVGTGLGLAFGISWFGPVGGLALAVGLTLVLAAAIPALFVAIGA
jgi:hypothetical protein